MDDIQTAWIQGGTADPLGYHFWIFCREGDNALLGGGFNVASVALPWLGAKDFEALVLFDNDVQHRVIGLYGGQSGSNIYIIAVGSQTKLKAIRELAQSKANALISARGPARQQPASPPKNQ